MSKKVLVNREAVERVMREDGLPLGVALIFCATPVPDEITVLRAKLEEAETENERVRQANLDVMMHFDDMKAAKELAEWRLNAFTVAALLICREEAVEWDSDRLQTYKNYAEVCGRRIGELSKSAVDAFMLRKQGEAVEDIYEGAAGFETDADGVGFVWASDIKDHAQRLRTQAAEIEKGAKP